MNNKKHTILIVDDEPVNLKELQLFLENDYNLLFAIDGFKVFDIIKKTKPDLILLDIILPGMDGYEICKKLKSQESTKEIPVLFISCLNESPEILKAFDVGGVDYITKPFKAKEVLARVKAQLTIYSSKHELSENYEKLKQIEQQRDDLANMIIHDMGSLLTILDWSLNDIKDYFDTQENSNMLMINSALNANKMLNHMTHDILDVHRLETNRINIKLNEIDLSFIVEYSVQTVKELTFNENIKFEDSDPLIIFGDERLIQRIIINLIINAIKHTPTDTPIWISVKKETDTAKVEVRDEGIGVPQKYKDKIFEKFEILSAKKEDKYYSTGLGLTFCKLAVEAHGGKIGVDSIEGKGSTFYFTIPLKPSKI